MREGPLMINVIVQTVLGDLTCYERIGESNGPVVVYTHDLCETSAGGSRPHRDTACRDSSRLIRRPCSPAIRRP